MWYLYMIIGIVVVLPMFKILVQHCSKRTLQFIINVIVIVYCILPLIESICRLNIVRYLPVSNIYVAYFFFFAVDISPDMQKRQQAVKKLM